MKNIYLFVVAFCILCASFTFADDEAQDFKVPLTEEHKVLHKGIGEWKIEQKMWMDPNQTQPMVATGTAVLKSILGGRAVVEFVETTSETGTFNGYGLFTWNTMDKKYECSWIDVYSYYGVDEMIGTYNTETKMIDWAGTFIDPSSGQEFVMTMVENRVNDDVLVASFYFEVGDQKIKTMENTYTRVKKSVSAETSATVEIEIPPSKEGQK